MGDKENYIMYKNEVCKIVDKKHSSKVDKDYYTLIPIKDESLVIDVPSDNEFGFLRSLMTKEEAMELIHKMKKIPPLKVEERTMESTYKDLLYYGNQEDLVKLIKTTYLRNEAREKAKKKSSEKDFKYFEKAEDFLYQELAIALDIPFDETKSFIQKQMESE